VTRSSKPARSGPSEGLFRPAEHIAVVPQGSAIAILDLERGVMYATTPFGAEAWRSLVGSAPVPRRTVDEAVDSPANQEGSDSWARIAGYLLDRRIIEPVTHAAGAW
jgi:hypothetical protein